MVDRVRVVKKNKKFFMNCCGYKNLFYICTRKQNQMASSYIG